MPPTIITKESLYKRITELERKHCCNKNQFFDTFAEFPAEGAAGVLYIDKETGIIYIWDTLNSEYIVANHTPNQKTVTILSTGWVIDGDYYKYTYNDVDILTETVVDVTPLNVDLAVVLYAGILPQVVTFDGGFYLYSQYAPYDDFGIIINIFI